MIEICVFVWEEFGFCVVVLLVFDVEFMVFYVEVIGDEGECFFGV